MYNIILTKRAVNSYHKLPDGSQNKFGEMLNELQYSFTPIRLSVKKLKGYKNTYRVRLGQWRVIYKVNNREKSILIYDILSRKSAY